MYGLAVLIPLVFVPFLLPQVAIAANRKALLDYPDERKRQSHAVLLMGGLVIVSVVFFTLLVLNVFYGLSELFPLICSVGILFSIGLVDDATNVGYRFKLILQILLVLFLFFAGEYKVVDLGGLFNISLLHPVSAFGLSLLFGLWFLNGANFADGIDGLCSGLGVLYGGFMAYWYNIHGFTAHAVFSLAFMGALMAFWIINVFSNKYKLYLGDSGSLVVGMFAYIAICPPANVYWSQAHMVDRYYVSFFMVLFCIILFDSIRVVVLRMIRHKSPFQPDRTHLHHLFVDLGYTHLLATTIIIIINLIIIAAWAVTSLCEMPVDLQFIVLVVFAGMMIWGTYFVLEHFTSKNTPAAQRYKAHIQRVSHISELFRLRVMSFIDHRKYSVLKELYENKKLNPGDDSPESDSTIKYS